MDNGAAMYKPSYNYTGAEAATTTAAPPHHHHQHRYYPQPHTQMAPPASTAAAAAAPTSTTTSQVLFSLLDRKRTGLVPLQEIERRWRVDAVPNLPGVLDALRAAAPGDGLISYEMFDWSLRVSLARVQRMKGGAADHPGGNSTTRRRYPYVDVYGNGGGGQQRSDMAPQRASYARALNPLREDVGAIGESSACFRCKTKNIKI